MSMSHTGSDASPRTADTNGLPTFRVVSGGQTLQQSRPSSSTGSAPSYIVQSYNAVVTGDSGAPRPHGPSTTSAHDATRDRGIAYGACPQQQARSRHYDNDARRSSHPSRRAACRMNLPTPPAVAREWNAPASVPPPPSSLEEVVAHGAVVDRAVTNEEILLQIRLFAGRAATVERYLQLIVAKIDDLDSRLVSVEASVRALQAVDA